MSAALTPEKVAEMLTELDVTYNEALNCWVGIEGADGNIARILVEPTKQTSYGSKPDTDNATRFRAVVVEGDQTPIVAKRPDLTDPLEYEGGSVEDDDIEGWQALQREGTDYVTIRGSGRISFAEARRMGAALIALADQGEAETL